MSISRRSFLKTSSTLLGGFSLLSFKSPLISVLESELENDHVLVLIQLNGGNDGLNTVIPLGDYSNYFRVRSNIAISESKILKLNGYDDTGLHPSLGGIQNLFNEGNLKIIHAVGYPEPSYSHFHASDIMVSGSGSERVSDSGWAARFLENEYPGFPIGYPKDEMPDPPAIQIGHTSSLLFQGTQSNLGMSIKDSDAFYNSIGNIEDPTPDTYWGDQLQYLRHLSQQTASYSSVIKNAASKVPVQGAYPQTHLAQQLKIVARLIKGGLKTKVYLVSTSGFDTHASQLDDHAKVLSEVSESISYFMKDVKGLGIEDRVTGMTFSEFGRRIHSNASGGTDHGAAGPMFIFGKKIESGIIGNNPNLPLSLVPGDNVPYQFDFRSVYRTLLTDWFCVPEKDTDDILFDNYQKLSLYPKSDCQVALPYEDNRNIWRREAQDEVLKVYPNPFTHSTTVSFKSRGTKTLLQLIDGSGKVIKVIANDQRTIGSYSIPVDGSELPPGNYYIRIQDQYKSAVKSILKVR